MRKELLFTEEAILRCIMDFYEGQNVGDIPSYMLQYSRILKLSIDQTMDGDIVRILIDIDNDEAETYGLLEEAFE